MRSEKLIAHNVVVGGGTIAAGLLGVAFQSLVSHQLRSADYGAVFAVVTLITFVGLPASSFSLLMAREASRGHASGHHAMGAALLRNGNRALLALGIGLGVAIVLASPILSKTFDVPLDLWWAAAAGMPFALALPLLMGQLQGDQRFVALMCLTFGQAALKLLGAVLLGALLGPLGVIGGISLASLIVYAVAIRLLKTRLPISAHVAWLGPALSYLSIVVPSTLALAVLVSSDVLIVKHYFPVTAAGQYSAVAAIGRAVFWGASGVALVLFPKVSFRGAQGHGAQPIVIASLALVALGGATAYALLSISAPLVLRAFAGPTYAGGSAYLPAYAVGMMLLGAVAVLVASLQSRGRPGFLAILLPLAVLEPLLLLAFHTSLVQVVMAMDGAMAVSALALGAWYVFDSRSARRPISLPVAPPAVLRTAPELETSR